MTKYKVVFNGEEQDEIFSTYEAADEWGLELQSAERVGAETLNLSNPGDYEYDEETWKSSDYEIIETE